MAVLRNVPIEDIEEVFAAYCLALGKVAHSWNYMQEELSRLFVICSGMRAEISHAVWNALKSDRSQRDILRAALQSNQQGLEPDFVKGVTWILDQAEKVAFRRNNAIHAPCMVQITDGPIEIAPNYFKGNPQALNLKDKDISLEFEWYEKSAECLSRYSQHLREVKASAKAHFFKRPPTLPVLKSNLKAPKSRTT